MEEHNTTSRRPLSFCDRNQISPSCHRSGQPEGHDAEKLPQLNNDDRHTNPIRPPEKWNVPAIDRYRTLATIWSFLILGLNDGSYGALVPFLETYYDLNHTIVSLVFLSPFVGYTIASAVNNIVHVRFGQRGVACVAPLCHVVAYLTIALHPTYPVLVLIFTFIGLGNGLIDAAWCAWVGVMVNSHQLLGILQASYALGATISPLIIEAIVMKGGLGWYAFYYVMVGLSVFEFFTSAYLFWSQTGAVYLADNPRHAGDGLGRTRQALKNKLTWIFAIFIFGYNGAEVSIGGWIVEFMTHARGASNFIGGATATGFWGGMTVGRLVLSFLTARLGESRSMLLYLGFTIAFELVLWLVPDLVTSVVAAVFLGIAIGPIFPTTVSLITKVMPRALHVSTIGFATAFGGSGGAIWPFIVGAIIQVTSIMAFHPIIVAICAALVLLWFLLPRETHGLATDVNHKVPSQDIVQ
ncbi:MFS general substrate transporter [Nemania sp. FL0916]|nr:MFS general substrate transporter [Nemania sp. FL0916]